MHIYGAVQASSSPRRRGPSGVFQWRGRAKDAGFPLLRERRSARSGKKTLRRWRRRPREGGDPVARSSGEFGRKTLGSRFRGNDGARVRAKKRCVAGFVVPAKAGTQWRVPVASSGERRWVPASAGTTEHAFGQKNAASQASSSPRRRGPIRRPREGGDPVARSRVEFGRKTLGSRFRGTTERAWRVWPPLCPRAIIRDQPSPSPAPPPSPIHIASRPHARVTSRARSADRRASCS